MPDEKGPTLYEAIPSDGRAPLTQEEIDSNPGTLRIDHPGVRTIEEAKARYAADRETLFRAAYARRKATGRP